MGRSQVLRWVFFPPPYSESVDEHRWRQAMVVRGVVLVLALGLNVAMLLRLPTNPVFDAERVGRWVPILITNCALDLGLCVLMFRYAWARKMWLLYFIVALELWGNLVTIQGIGSLHSNILAVSVGVIAFYRVYFGWRLGIWALLCAVIPHVAVILLEMAGVLDPMPWFLGKPLAQYTVPSMQWANMVMICGAYVVAMFGANAISNLLREKERALAAAKREAAKIVDDVKHGRLTGTVLDEEFGLGELLGRGGMGEIYAARRTSDDSRVAVKVLHQYLGREHTMLQRFEREAELASRLDGNCTAEVFGVGYDPESDLHYIAMEYLRGEDLWSFLRRHEYLTPDRVFALGRAMARVLDQAHTAGIVHRDLKPQNVFMLRDGAEFEIRLLDFGIARLVDSLPGSTLTVAAEVIGTPGYMPPEQAVGNQALIGPATDRFALAAILYRALTGQLPFPAKQIHRYINEVTNAKPTAASSLRAGIPDTVDAVFERALAKRPEDRYHSSLAIVDALEAAFEMTPATGPSRQLAVAATIPGAAAARA